VLKIIAVIVVLAVVVVLVLAARKPDRFRVQRSASIAAPPAKVGTGRMEIVESSAPSKVAIQLDFLKPFEGHNIATFTMEPAGKATNVSWVMDGPTPFIGKIMHVFINMDRMVGTDFEAGLAELKTAAEHEPARSAS
jgi:hypothetical protein